MTDNRIIALFFLTGVILFAVPTTTPGPAIIAPFLSMGTNGFTTSSAPAGIFNATYSFTTDTVGNNPASFVPTESGGGTVRVVTGLGGHANIVNIHDPNAGAASSCYLDFTNIATLNISFWFYLAELPSSTFQLLAIYGDSGTLTTFLLAHNVGGNSRLSLLYASAWNNIAPLDISVWHYFSIYLDSVGSDTITIDIDRVRIGEYPFQNHVAQFNRIDVGGTDTNTNSVDSYYDAFDFSFDSQSYYLRNYVELPAIENYNAFNVPLSDTDARLDISFVISASGTYQFILYYFTSNDNAGNTVAGEVSILQAVPGGVMVFLLNSVALNLVLGAANVLLYHTFATLFTCISGQLFVVRWNKINATSGPGSLFISSAILQPI